ncbi:MAG: hypothetical protein H0X45_13830 [Planctomycetes bacterium]|nr:hypothetical protein [Planctomycetota bacterium]
MRALVPTLFAAVLAAQDIGPQAIDRGACEWPIPDCAQAVAGMAGDQRVAAAFRARGLDMLSLTWEDTGRWQGSSVGPNISDLTIQVLGRQQAHHGWCMPVVRYPNFADTTCDVPIDRLKLLVGNERGSTLRAIDLRSYLREFAAHQHAPTGFLKGALVGDRDAVVLASAQACFLPVERGQTTTFAPVLFNYQSSASSPAVLTIVATPEGTSAQVITNDGQAASGVWHGQRLFHNRAGQRAPLTAKRFSDHHAQQAANGGALGQDAATRDGLSLVVVIQVPLVVPEMRRGIGAMDACAGASAATCEMVCEDEKGGRVETAVIASGPVEGPWLGLANCTIERDFRFPIRATVQFYQATDQATVGDADVQRVAKAIERIYLDADAVGSLVVDGATGRATGHQVVPAAWPQSWWQTPCEAYATRHGERWQDALARVRARLGADWQPADARELANALELARR